MLASILCVAVGAVLGALARFFCHPLLFRTLSPSRFPVRDANRKRRRVRHRGLCAHLDRRSRA